MKSIVKIFSPVDIDAISEDFHLLEEGEEIVSGGTKPDKDTPPDDAQKDKVPHSSNPSPFINKFFTKVKGLWSSITTSLGKIGGGLSTEKDSSTETSNQTSAKESDKSQARINKTLKEIKAFEKKVNRLRNLKFPRHED